MINFLNRATGCFYAAVLRSLIDPITEYLSPQFVMESDDCQNKAVNVHFFRERKGYLDQMHPNRGINVFISHGIADKNWRDAPFVDVFDYICVSGPLWVDKMVRQGIGKNRLFITGYTKMDPLFQWKYPRTPGTRKRILWVPTHNLDGWTLRTSVSTYPLSNELMNKFPETVEIIVSPHPANSESGPTIQALVDADVVISDCSSLLYEAWALDKQVVFPDWLVKDAILMTYPESFEAYIYQNKIGLHANSITELIDYTVNAPQCVDTQVQQFIEGIFPATLRGKSGERTAQLLMEVAKNELS